MKAKSLSVFRTKLHRTDEGTVLIAAGQIIDGDEEHMRALARNRLVVLLEESEPPATPETQEAPQPPNKARRVAKPRSK